MRNILGSGGSKVRAEVAAAAKLVFQAADLDEAHRRLTELAERFANGAPKAVACLEAGFDDAVAVMALNAHECGCFGGVRVTSSYETRTVN